jgi:hypothetical protein
MKKPGTLVSPMAASFDALSVGTYAILRVGTWKQLCWSGVLH